MNIDSYDWIGNSWRLFPPATGGNYFAAPQPNIVRGVDAIAASLIHLLLLEPGEDPIHPSLGYAPHIFRPKSDRSPSRFGEDLAAAINRWNQVHYLGIESLKIAAQDVPGTDYVGVSLSFVPSLDWQEHILSFNYFSYPQSETSIDFFLQSLKFDGSSIKESFFLS